MTNPHQFVRDNGAASFVSIQGRITIDSSGEMRRKLLDALRSKPDHLTVDLSAVSYLDSSGLATLFEAERSARAQSTRLVLTGLQGQPRRFLEFPQLAGLFEIADQEAKA
jgi:anti-sigma B factor antagonist